MAMLQSGYWQDLTTTDFAAADPEQVIALLPVAAIEQHGPHLPLGTDACINAGIVRHLLAHLPAELTVLVLPPQTIGDSLEHQDFAGTLTLSAQTILHSWTAIGAGVARAGVRKLLILNSHGGQPQLVDLVALRLRRSHRMLVVKANTFAFGVPAGLFDDQEMTYGIHGGAIETSLMLYLCPERVRQAAAADFASLAQRMTADYALLQPEGMASFAWLTQDLNTAGVCGNAGNADAERGRLLLEHIVQALLQVLRDIRRFPLSLLQDTAGAADRPD